MVRLRGQQEAPRGRIPPSVAQAYIANYFQKYHGVRDYIEKSLEVARERGYVTTIMNRRRYLPDIASSNRSVRQFAERIGLPHSLRVINWIHT
jgi:DNA polymerase-1